MSEVKRPLGHPDDYCGFVCSDVVEKAKEIRKELDDFAKYNPNEAEVVLGNVLKALEKK